MVKSFLSWGTALLVLCSGLLSSCDDKNEGGGNSIPTVTVAIGDANSTSLSFNLTLKDADNCAYLCTKASETVPTAEAILAEGKTATASGTVTIDNLDPSTAYRLSAVARKGKVLGKVSSIEHTTSAPDVHPAVALTPGTTTATSLAFTAELTDPETAAYVCLEKVDGLVIPTAEEILRDGTPIAQTGEVVAGELKPATTYVIAAAVANAGFYSAVESIEMTTDRDMNAPAVFDRQVAGGYYGVPEGSRYGEYLVVLSEGNAIQTNGVYTTVEAGRAMSLDLYQMAPSKLDNIILPDRTYKYSANPSISTFTPAKTFCMVNDGKGNISKVEFKAGTIAITKSGSTFTVKATLTTTDDKEFTAEYTGPIAIEDKTGSTLDPLPDLGSDVTGVTFVRALAKYYDNESGTANDCVVNLYDVQPKINDGSDYLSEAGHMVSLYLVTAASDTPALQEGTYTVSDAGTPGTFEPGDQIEFMETMLAIGTYCEERNDKAESVYGFIKSGTVTVSKAGTGYRFALDLTTDKGHKVSGTYEGAVEITDKR